MDDLHAGPLSMPMLCRNALTSCLRTSWTEILGHLSLKDLLRARLVCKGFICLDQLKSVSMTWSIADENAASSLMVFVSRHCTPPGSPQVSVTIKALPYSALWSGCMMASGCANLQSLDCLSLKMRLPVAQACLQLLPKCIGTLKLFAPARLIDEAGWNRLTSLHTLHLRWPWVTISTAYVGGGLAQLPALHTLCIWKPDQFTTASRKQLDKLQGSQASMAELRRLTFLFDPFHGRPDFTKLPMLEHIYAANLDPLPKWLEDLPLIHLKLCSSRQLVGIELSRLCCRNLLVRLAHWSPAWQLADLLKLPMLRHLFVHWLSPNEEAPPTILFEGSQAEYLAFMEVKVELMIPGKLRLQGSSGEAAVIELSSCGHACICLCAKCRSHDE